MLTRNLKRPIFAPFRGIPRGFPNSAGFTEFCGFFRARGIHGGQSNLDHVGCSNQIILLDQMGGSNQILDHVGCSNQILDQVGC